MFNPLTIFKKKVEEVEVWEGTPEPIQERVFDIGVTDIKDFIAPPSFEKSSEDFLKVGDMYARNYVINGFPASISVGWLDLLLHGSEDVDVAIHINPADDRAALDELTDKITQFEAQLYIENEKGSIKNRSILEAKISALWEQRARLEQNYENLFHIQIAVNLYAESKEKLIKDHQKIDNKLKGRKVFLMPTYLRQSDGYKSALPIGKTYLNDMMRNFNTGALSACFMFYNAEICHETGIFLGVNLETNTPVLIDFYDRNRLLNSNLTVFGQAGSGKTFATSLITLRSALRGVRTVIIDPENEYRPLTRALGGSLIQLAPNSKHQINPFDIEEEEIEGTLIIDIKQKIGDLLNLIGVMAGGLTAEQRAAVARALQRTYDDFEITSSPDSLYLNESFYDSTTDTFLTEGQRKLMPRFSDFYDVLFRQAESDSNKETIRLARSLEIFKEGGVYDLFDCYTSPELANFKKSPVVTFDVMQLEENVLRPIGMYVALSWTWEKFAKKNPHIKKRIICDEAWMMVSQNLPGNEYTGQFLENCSRRIRKRNGGLLVSSQNFVEFASSEQGKAVLTNAVTNIFLRQNPTDIDALQALYKLSDGERNFLLQANRGEVLIKTGQTSTIAQIHAFPYEIDLISKQNNQVTQ